jgi:hypothetical protein
VEVKDDKIRKTKLKKAQNVLDPDSISKKDKEQCIGYFVRAFHQQHQNH